MKKTMSIFGNQVSGCAHKKAISNKNKLAKKFGSDENANYKFSAVPNEILGKPLGLQNLIMGEEGAVIDRQKSILIGTIRMGYGHYRIGIAVASAANSLGITPYWFDFMAYQETTGGKIINHLNKLYSLGSRLSQKYKLFNKFYWEPLTAEGFKKLSYNASDREMCSLMAPVYKNISKQIPVAATHAWTALAAVHAGMERIINMIPDNWPLGLHLAEGAVHTVQSQSSLFGYMTLKNMAKKGTPLKPMPAADIKNTGHYIDHELVSNIEKDCDSRIRRRDMSAAPRVLISIGGAGAQSETAAAIIKQMAPRLKEGSAALFINAGDHSAVADFLKKEFAANMIKLETHTEWKDTVEFAKRYTTGHVEGAHLFYNTDIFAAVYTTNLLIRCCDVLVTKPSELAFYPVPKLMIQRVGGHEAWGAIRSAELGDGTIECENQAFALQMLDLMMNEKSIIKSMCENIIKQKKIGTYDGAYNVVKLAMQRTRI